MKRLIMLLLVAIFSLSLIAGCGKKKEEAQTQEPTTEQTTPAPTDSGAVKPDTGK
jgi:hypothetical protein